MKCGFWVEMEERLKRKTGLSGAPSPRPSDKQAHREAALHAPKSVNEDSWSGPRRGSAASEPNCYGETKRVRVKFQEWALEIKRAWSKVLPKSRTQSFAKCANDWGTLIVTGTRRGISERTGRSPSDVIDACDAAMTLANHHDWVKYAADRLVVGGSVLWQAMCAEWAKCCLKESDAKTITDTVKATLGGHPLPETGKAQGELY